MIGTDDLPITVPGVAGLRFRHFAGQSDIPAMVAINVAVRRANGVVEVPTIESMANQYANLTNSDTSRDLAIVELDGRLVGYVRVEWSDQTDGSRAYDSNCLLHPDLLGRGIGRAMLGWAEDRIREIAASHPGEQPRWFGSETWDPEPAGTRLLTRSGYRPARTFYEMIRPNLDDIPSAPLPVGFEVRPVGRGDLRRIWDAQLTAFADNWDRPDGSDEAFARFVGHPRLDPSLYVVAFAGDEVAGAVLNTEEDTDEDADGADLTNRRGTLEVVFVRRPYRRRGLGRSLIVRSLELLKGRGYTSAVLGVDAENADDALHLYTSCGFEAGRSVTVWRKPLDPTSEKSG